MERSDRPSAGADVRHPLTSARPMRQSAIQQGRRARANRTCRAIFRIDTVFILQSTSTSSRARCSTDQNMEAAGINPRKISTGSASAPPRKALQIAI